MSSGPQGLFAGSIKAAEQSAFQASAVSENRLEPAVSITYAAPKPLSEKSEFGCIHSHRSALEAAEAKTAM